MNNSLEVNQHPLLSPDELATTYVTGYWKTDRHVTLGLCYSYITVGVGYLCYQHVYLPIMQVHAYTSLPRLLVYLVRFTHFLSDQSSALIQCTCLWLQLPSLLCMSNFTEAFFAYLVYYNWYGYLVAQSAMITYNTAYLISQPAIITSSYMHMPCLVYMSIKSTMPKYHSKFPIAFCAHLVSFSNIRFILSNGTYTTEFVVSNHAGFKIIRQHYGFIWRGKPLFK